MAQRLPMERTALPPSFHAAAEKMSSLILSADDANLGEAFTDDVDILGDPIIQLMLGGFGLIVVLIAVANFLASKMDSAIENVLEDFEETMKTRYIKRWKLIEEELEGLDEAERVEKLIQVMEEIQRDEPALMERINRDMASS
eukprot:CAMPEP_0185730040 /NCGR_PEP_ID=MMETSP1171-20130828/8222_1 /TAXON_ID=374046 /ORGANISM="Helicotheca tamensis, Strain CCMP826" /LENGTH=142 /DNA_ID=CAMNT_0028399015 /DNA_START=222 /DNA_END=650 /DNA_ORIENTATION=+